MDKKTVLAFALSGLIIVGWQLIFPPQPPTEQIIESAAQETKVADSVDTSSNNNAVQGLANTVNSTSNTPVKVEKIKVDTDLIDVEFNSATGNIVTAAIHGWKDEEGKYVRFNQGSDTDYAHINLGIQGIDGNFTLTSIAKENNEQKVIFTASNGTYIVTKTYTLSNNSYLVKTQINITNNSGVNLNVPISISIGAGLGSGFGEASYDVFEGALINNGSTTEKVKLNKDSSEALTGADWIGYSSKYFLFAMLSNGVFSSSAITPKGNNPLASAQGNIAVNAGSTSSSQFDLFIGPKYYQELKKVGHNLQKSMDFGWFYFLSIPMLYTLNYLYGVVHNYGIAIVILTIIIKILTLPLTMKSMQSMKALSALQPEVMKIRDKYKNDPQRLNQETMKLYKDHNVNPLSGCLPLLLQIPIFFALYKALLLSLELKGAPFFGWIVDLSLKDPYFVTPVLMGVTMFIQQKMTPTTADPIQQKIFLAMPVILTIVFINFPAGLVIYWLTNNILSIIQQYFVNKQNK